MALKAIGQERRQLDVERYDPIRKFPPIPYPLTPPPLRLNPKDRQIAALHALFASLFTRGSPPPDPNLSSTGTATPDTSPTPTLLVSAISDTYTQLWFNVKTPLGRMIRVRLAKQL